MRIGEMPQLRKEDVRREGKDWVVHVTPEAGPVNTDEAETSYCTGKSLRKASWSSTRTQRAAISS